MKGAWSDSLSRGLVTPGVRAEFALERVKKKSEVNITSITALYKSVKAEFP